MKKQNVLATAVWVLTIAFVSSACQKSAAENNVLVLSQTSPSVSPTLILTPILTPTPKLNLPIRKVDFKNFTYPLTEDQGGGEEGETFTLKNGKQEVNEQQIEATLQTIEYGDVTNDGKEEAMISVYPWSGGNCQCYMVFIYTSENEKPKLLWSFDTWDKAQGGFKRAYAEKGDLIVETFGDNKFENDKWDFDTPEDKFDGLCCPTAYTKIRFKWNSEKFAAVGKPELFDYDWKKEMNKKQN